MDLVELAVFPYDAPAISGCLIKGEQFKPGAGAVVYLNAGDKLGTVRNRVEAAGGDMGVFTWIQDTEGNTVGLHALK